MSRPTADPSACRAIWNLLIPLSDGATLAADLHLPADDAPCPVLVSFNPYRKDDIAGAFSEHWRRHLVERGYGQLLVDVRGTGGSSGASADTFDPQEGRDGAEVVEWVAEQPWCDGRVGLWGMSYGGTMTLATAALRPAHLVATVAIYGTAEVYGHSNYPGGCPIALGRMARESWMLALALAPPAHRDAAGRWYDVWRDRLARLDDGAIHSLHWPEHPHRDEYWQRRAIDVEAIEVPTFVFGAWRDIYPQAMVDVYARLRCPKRLLMGPWLHASPDTASIEQVEWLDLLARWWDEWIGGARTPPCGAPVTIYVQGAGTWRHEAAWPIERTQTRVLHLTPGGGLSEDAPAVGAHRYRGDPRTGAGAGLWSPLGVGVGYPLDQAGDAALSLTYVGEPLAEDLEITGSPEASLVAALIDGPELELAVKLIDVGPDRTVTLITTGWLRADHRESHAAPQPLERDLACELRVPLWATSYLVRAGHRLGLSIACADFPRVWPTTSMPEIEIRLGLGASRLSLPVVAPPSEPPATTLVSLPRPTPGVDRSPWNTAAASEWKIVHDLIAASVSVVLGGTQELALPDGSMFAVRHHATATVARDHPDEARVDASSGIELLTPGGTRYGVTTSSVFFRGRSLLEGEVTIDDRSYYRGRWRNF
jgi:putative CocE/NonD family hydrolase